MHNYISRWKNALRWAQKIKASFDTGKYILVHDEEIYTPNYWKIEIDEERQFIILICESKNSRERIYEYDLEYDHGSYDTIAVSNERFSTYKLYKVEE